MKDLGTIKCLFNTEKDRERFINAIKREYPMLKLSKPYKKEGSRTRIYVNLR